MRVLGLDPSLTGTGICEPDGTCLTWGSDPKERWEERVSTLTAAVMGAVFRTSSDVVAIEECMVRHPHLPSLWLHGSLRLAMWRNSVPYIDINSSRRQKWACGDQKNRDKDAVLARAIHAGSAAGNNNEADAWWLHRIARTAYLGDANAEHFPLYQREVLASIDWPEIDGHKPMWPKMKKTTKKKEPAA